MFPFLFRHAFCVLVNMSKQCGWFFPGAVVFPPYSLHILGYFAARSLKCTNTKANKLKGESLYGKNHTAYPPCLRWSPCCSPPIRRTMCPGPRRGTPGCRRLPPPLPREPTPFWFSFTAAIVLTDVRYEFTTLSGFRGILSNAPLSLW